MKRLLLLAVAVAASFLSGCASLSPAKAQEHMWALANGNAFGVRQVRCDVDFGAFVNRSNQSISAQTFRLIATNGVGITRGEWIAYCQPAGANGTSTCNVRYLGGKPRTHIPESDGGCAEFAKFTLLN